MIEINLIPPQFRKRQKKNFSAAGVFNLPREILGALIGGLFAVLILIHVLLQLAVFGQLISHASLKAEWAKIQPQKQEVDVVLNEMRSALQKIGAVEKVTTGKRLIWAKKLNDISDSLPRGTWLSRISLDGKVFLLEGSAYSKLKNEMMSVGDLVTSLKNSKTFMEGLENIDVGSIQRRQLKAVDIADFFITVRLK